MLFAERQHERDGVVGDLAGAVVGGVADGDPHAAEALEVHLVVADGGLHEDAAFSEFVDGGGGRVLADDGVGVRPLLVGDGVGAGAENGGEVGADGVAGDGLEFGGYVWEEDAHRRSGVLRFGVVCVG